MTEKELRKKAMALPLQPGVYIMKTRIKKSSISARRKSLKTEFPLISARIPIILLK